MLDREIEKNLLERAKEDKEAFGKIFEEYFSLILNYIFGRVGSKEDAKDLTEEVFTRALFSIDKYKDKGIPYSNYLLKIATNIINDFIKQNRRLILKNDIEIEYKEDFLDIEEKKFFIIQKAILKLPLKYQNVLSLKIFEKKKIKEISDILDINESTVKTILKRGTEKLKEELKKDETFLKEFSL
ncbi:MAG: RNA polymerase sigma factor [Caldisericia bacterium]